MPNNPQLINKNIANNYIHNRTHIYCIYTYTWNLTNHLTRIHPRSTPITRKWMWRKLCCGLVKNWHLVKIIVKMGIRNRKIYMRGLRIGWIGMGLNLLIRNLFRRNMRTSRRSLWNNAKEVMEFVWIVLPCWVAGIEILLLLDILNALFFQYHSVLWVFFGFYEVLYFGFCSKWWGLIYVSFVFLLGFFIFVEGFIEFNNNYIS